MALSHSPKIITDGLVLCLDAANPKSYPGSGTAWTDISGNGNNGTLVNGVGFSSSNAGSLVFDGVDDYVTLGTKVVLPADILGYSFSAWWKVENTSGRPDVIISKGGSCFIEMSTGGNLVVFIGVSGRSAPFNTNVAINLNEWYCVFVVWDGADLIAYLNGVEVARRVNDGTSIIVEDLRIGTNAANNSGWWPGNIAQVAMYNRALTADEVQQNFNALRGRYGV